MKANSFFSYSVFIKNGAEAPFFEFILNQSAALILSAKAWIFS
jgi:hypothetical protein